MIPDDWIRVLQLVTNVAVIGGLIKLVRIFSQIEFRVNLMWDAYQRELVNQHSHDRDRIKVSR